MEFVEWQVLTQEWSSAFSKARLKEAVIVDRMNSFLKGNGCMPSMADLAEVEALWQTHMEKREALNQFVAKIIGQYADSTPASKTVDTAKNAPSPN